MFVYKPVLRMVLTCMAISTSSWWRLLHLHGGDHRILMVDRVVAWCHTWTINTAVLNNCLVRSIYNSSYNITSIILYSVMHPLLYLSVFYNWPLTNMATSWDNFKKFVVTFYYVSQVCMTFKTIQISHLHNSKYNNFIIFLLLL